MIRLDDLPPPQSRTLELVREVAAEKQLLPFLVGGPVRDVQRMALFQVNCLT